MTQTATYRTKDGADYFRFGFVQISDGSWRAYILAMPSYADRAEDLHLTHRKFDPAQGLHYADCLGPSARELQGIRALAAQWAELTQQYIRAGSPMPSPQAPDSEHDAL